MGCGKWVSISVGQFYGSSMSVSEEQSAPPIPRAKGTQERMLKKKQKRENALGVGFFICLELVYWVLFGFFLEKRKQPSASKPYHFNTKAFF